MNVIKELWHGNICPQTDSRNNSPEMKELMEYMALSKSSTIAGASTRAMPKKPSSNMLSSLVCRLQ